ncbi:TPA: hypothetical protein DDZ01_02475 [Candidatus Uhrbacteria bacterium]|nr:MAG: hypothetical protein UT94_C0061G0001 [Candidatus Uhrbacteria bacterium GW2011_GWF2_40_263]HBK34835.1 hypothetical protein [Candidatus Uhrbacteria bacterium]HCB56217.1 hypothetical protein [Candidatus Uhrbacteria bacterium]
MFNEKHLLPRELSTPDTRPASKNESQTIDETPTRERATTDGLKQIFDNISTNVVGDMVAKFEELLPHWESDVRRYKNIADFWSDLAEAAVSDYLKTNGGVLLSKQLEDIDLDWQEIKDELAIKLIEMRRSHIIDVRLREFKNVFYRLHKSNVRSHLKSRDFDWFLDHPSYPDDLKKLIQFMRENGMTEDEKERFAEMVRYLNSTEDVEI